jgi:hypothetical protein
MGGHARGDGGFDGFGFGAAFDAVSHGCCLIFVGLLNRRMLKLL